MKNLFFSLIAIVFFNSLSFAQRTTQEPVVLNYPEPYQIFKNVLENKFNVQVNTLNKTSNQRPELLAFENENEAQTFMSPLLQPAIGVLHFEGFNDADIIDEYGSLNSSKIIQAAVILFGSKTKELKMQLGLMEVNAEGKVGDYDLITSCAIDAIGITAITQLFSVGIKQAIKDMGKKAVLKMVGKVAAKYIGWVGAAWAAYDFYECITTGD